VRRSVRGDTLEVHGRAILRERTAAGHSSGSLEAALQQHTVILKEDDLFLMELSIITAHGAQFHGSLLSAA